MTRSNSPPLQRPAVRGDHTFFSYYLGPDSYGFDSEWLDIEFDGAGRVIGLDVVSS